MVLAWTACGITTLPILEPPIAGPPSNVGKTFEFDGADPATVDRLLFEGYELYYRFYVDTDYPTDLTSLSELTGAGFMRLHQAGDTDGNISKPLVAVPFEDRDDAHSVTITILFGQTPEEPWFSGSWGGGNTELRRATTDQWGIHELISDTGSFDAADFDVADLFDPTLVTTGVRLLLYALTYGRDFSVDVHSEAVFLGEIIINLP